MSGPGPLSPRAVQKRIGYVDQVVGSVQGSCNPYVLAFEFLRPHLIIQVISGSVLLVDEQRELAIPGLYDLSNKRLALLLLLAIRLLLRSLRDSLRPQAAFPPPWCTMKVHYGDDEQLVVPHLIDDAVRESIDQTAASSLGDE